MFNIVHNKSHLWGIKPFLWYFYAVLPNIFFTSTVFIPLILIPKFSSKFVFVSFLFIFLYSFLPHKELRFIIYAVPLLNFAISQSIVSFVQLIDSLPIFLFRCQKNRLNNLFINICSKLCTRYVSYSK